MLSITNLNAGQAGTYYSRDAYYTATGGQWQGRGAEALGLSGQVKRQDFQNLVQGRDPQGNQLIQSGPEGGHRAGIDMTFSAPKSVSILSQIDKSIVEAHKQAVQKTLGYIEKHYAQARITKNGVTRPVNTGSFVIAKFDHQVSRELDPQLHTHAVALNMTQRPDGGWRAVHNDTIYSDKILLGQVYRNQLAANLKKLGYSISTGKKGLFEVQGVSQKLIDAFSQRSQQIDKKVQELQKQYPNANAQRLREMACLGSRVAKKDVNMHVVRSTWMKRMQALGYDDPERIVEAAKREAEKERKAGSNGKQLGNEEYIRVAARALTESESVFTKKDLLKAACQLSVGQSTVGELHQKLNWLTAGKELVCLNREKQVYTTKEMQKIESGIVAQARNTQGTMAPVMTKAQVEKVIKGKYKHLTGGQQRALGHILTSGDQVIGVQGDAGTGKTTMINAVRAELEAKGYTVRGLSYTGKAAMELQKGAGVASKTVHSFLGTFDNHSLKARDVATYQKYAKRLSEKEWKDLKKDVSERDLKRATGIRSLFVKTQVSINSDGSLKVKTQSITNAIKDYLKDRVRNYFNRWCSLVSRRHKVHEINKTKDLLYRTQNGHVYKAKQLTHWETDRAGFRTRYESVTYLQQGDIIHYSIKQVGNVTTVQSKVIKNPANTIQKGREVWMVDEATMVGSKQMAQLMNAAKQAQARVVLVGDTKQLQAISAGRVFEDLQQTGAMKTAHMSDVVRQQNQAYRQVVTDISQKRIEKAFSRLHQQGKIIQCANYNQAQQQIVERYDRDTLVVVGRNNDRKQLNSVIRAKLKAEHQISDSEHIAKTRQSKNIRGVQRHFASNYDKGDIVAVTRGGAGVKVGAEGKVIKVDHVRNRITIQMQNKRGQVQQREIDLKQHGDKLAVYSESETAFSRGDKVVFLKNNQGLGVRNGETGIVQKVDRHGDISVKMDNGRVVSFNINKGYNYLDHGYCLTSYKSQGQTATKVIYHANTNFKNDYSSFYVGLTRGRKDALVITDNAAKLKRDIIENQQGKKSTLDYQKDPKSTNYGRSDNDGLKMNDRGTKDEKADTGANTITESQKSETSYAESQKSSYTENQKSEATDQQKGQTNESEHSNGKEDGREIEMER